MKHISPAVIEFAIQQQPALYAEIDRLKKPVDSLDACKAKMQECLDYLESRDDYADQFIDRAAHHLERGIAAIDEQIEEDKATDPPAFAELKRDDDRARAADIRAEQRK